MKVNFMKPKLLYSLFIFLCLTGNANAQSTGNIKGSITDNGKSPLPQVNIVLEKTNFNATTNGEGEYIISNIPPGSYRIVISHIGYQTINRSIFVKANETVDCSYALQASSFEIPSVEVYGERMTNIARLP